PRLVQVQYVFPEPHDHEYLLVCGLGNPLQAMNALRRAGYLIKKHVFLGDHHAYRLEQCQNWVKIAEHEGLKLLVTGKDAVKWKALGIPAQNYLVVEPVIQFEKGLEVWKRYLDF